MASRLSKWTNEDLKANLDYLGWHQIDLVEALNTTETSVSLMCTGKRRIPYYVEAYVNLMIRHVKLQQKLQRMQRKYG